MADEAGGSGGTPAGRENLCRRCGVCCHEKIRVGGQVVITDIPCAHLDAATNLCRIYASRGETEPRCLSADESARGGGLPSGCPYTEGIAGYRAPHLLGEHPEYGGIVDQLYPGRKT